MICSSTPFSYIKAKHSFSVGAVLLSYAQRIIDNNITNAIKYTFENEKIVVSLYKDEESCHFTIASHSRKIQEPKKIFEEYYREERSQDGFGLGLNLVKRLCKEENVKITVHSDENITSFSYQFKIENA